METRQCERVGNDGAGEEGDVRLDWVEMEMGEEQGTATESLSSLIWVEGRPNKSKAAPAQ